MSVRMRSGYGPNTVWHLFSAACTKRVRMCDCHGRLRHARLWGVRALSLGPAGGCMAPIHSIGTYTRREGHRANVNNVGHFGSRAKTLLFFGIPSSSASAWHQSSGSRASIRFSVLLLCHGPVCSSADPTAGQGDAEYVVQWYSLAEEGFVELSRRTTRAEAGRASHGEECNGPRQRPRAGASVALPGAPLGWRVRGRVVVRARRLGSRAPPRGGAPPDWHGGASLPGLVPSRRGARRSQGTRWSNCVATPLAGPWQIETPNVHSRLRRLPIRIL